MPQVDLQTLMPVCAGGATSDGKIACETLAGADVEAELPEKPIDVPSDLPPDSFWLSRDAEFDWFDRHAFYERKDSTRGGTSGGVPASAIPPSPNSANSQRFSANLKSKSSLIGLPKPQKTNLAVDTKHRRSSPATLFPKRTASLHEPSSPKVSCMGRVRSKKDKNRRSRNCRRRSDEQTAARRRRIGIFSSIRSLFFSGCKKRRAVAVEEPPVAAETPARKSSASTTVGHDIRELPPAAVAAVAASMAEGRTSVDSELPDLGAMNRFASGRRSESWVR